MAYMNEGKLDDAIRVGNEIVAIDANDAFAHTSLSMFYQRKDMIDEAEKEAAKARMISWKEDLKKNPDAPPPGPAGSMDVIQ
jgi:Tfp pilus assembly protein PilF